MSNAAAPSTFRPAALAMNVPLFGAFLVAFAAIVYTTSRLFLLVVEIPRLPGLEDHALASQALKGGAVGLGALVVCGLVYTLVRRLRVAVTAGLPSPFVSRLDGLLADGVLLGLFLGVGTAGLNILVHSITLVVGLARAAMLPEGFPNPEAGRFANDATSLLVAALCFGALGGAHLGYLRVRRRLLHHLVDSGFESFVSKRYLLAREGGGLVSLITIVSVLGVAVGVMALIVVQSVMSGFEHTLKSKFMGIYPHVEVMADPRFPVDEHIPRVTIEEMVAAFEALPDVVAAAPLMTYETVVQANLGAEERKMGVVFRGIEPAREKLVTDFYSYTVSGNGDPGDREVVIGRVLAQRLGVTLGDRLYGIGRIVATANRTAPRTMPLEVVGIFDSGIYEVDERFVITSLQTLQDLLVIEGDVATSIQVRVKNPDRPDLAGWVMAPHFPSGFGFRTWQDRNRTFFEALKVEKISMFIILLLIVLVAALNIIGTLVMTVVQKTRDIGILKSMGAAPGAIMRVFLLHGLLIGLVGTSLGTVWGLRLCWFVREDIDKIFELPEGVYGLDRLPVIVDPSEIWIMVGSAMFICIAASIIPAWQAARLNPVEALRYD